MKFSFYICRTNSRKTANLQTIKRSLHIASVTLIVNQNLMHVSQHHMTTKTPDQIFHSSSEHKAQAT